MTVNADGSSALLPSLDGKPVLKAATDFDANGVCETYAASGSVAHP